MSRRAPPSLSKPLQPAVNASDGAGLHAVHDLAPPYGQPIHRMPFPTPLVAGRLLRRRDRFLADVELDSGEVVVAHCVNTGRMEGLTLPGRRVYISHAPAPGRRLAYTWELTDLGGAMVGTNTAIPNRLVRELLEQRLLPPFAAHTELVPERRFGERSRVDFWLRLAGREHYLEVKNCHLVYPDQRGYFPDSISERATHHLHELSNMVAAGHDATVLFVVQRADAQGIRPSDAHDPVFARAARAAAAAGVRFLALCVEPTLEALIVRRLLPVDLQPYDTREPAGWRERLRAEAPAWENTNPRKPKARAAEPKPSKTKIKTKAALPAPKTPKAR